MFRYSLIDSVLVPLYLIAFHAVWVHSIHRWPLEKALVAILAQRQCDGGFVGSGAAVKRPVTLSLQADKRAHHNALERKRRDHIKDSFHSLRDSVPALQGEKVGKRHW